MEFSAPARSSLSCRFSCTHSRRSAVVRGDSLVVVVARLSGRDWAIAMGAKGHIKRCAGTGWAHSTGEFAGRRRRDATSSLSRGNPLQLFGNRRAFRDDHDGHVVAPTAEVPIQDTGDERGGSGSQAGIGAEVPVGAETVGK